jgi:hypothetical protein
LPLCTEQLEDRIAPAATLSLPASGFSGATNTTVMNFPIGISALSDGAGHVGLASATLAVTYPAGVFNFPSGTSQATADVGLGSIPLSDTAGTGGASDWTLTANSPADGQLNITLAAKIGDKITTNTFPGGGTLATINFPILPGAAPGDETIRVVAVSGSVHTQVIGGGSGTQTFTLAGLPASGTITVTAGVQNPPTIPATLTFSTGANAPQTQGAPGLLSAASDPQGEALSVGTVNGSAANVGVPLTLVSGGALTVQADGSFVYAPAADFVGADSFTWQAIDTGNSLSDLGTVALNVVPTLKIVPSTISSGPQGTVIEEGVVLDNPNPPGGAGPLASFNLALTYDSTVLTTYNDGSQIRPGSDLPAGWTYTFNAQKPGIIAIAGFGSGSGSDLVSGPSPLVLVTIDFNVASTTPQTTPIALVASVPVGAVTAKTDLIGSGGHFAINPALATSGFQSGVDTTITALAPTSVNIMPATLPAGDVDAAYTQTLRAAGGTAPYTFAVSAGALPPGLDLDPGSGVLSGTPTTNLESPFGFTITATDAASQSLSQYYSVVINPALSITTTALASWTAGLPGYEQTFAASGGSGSFTFTSAGPLPAGLTLSTGGVLSGTPTSAGSYSVTVVAGDQLGGSTSRTLNLMVNPPVTITTPALDGWLAGFAGYAQSIKAAGGTGTLTFALAAGALPAGLTLSSTGILTGTPTSAGSYTFAIMATDALGATGTQSYAVTIDPAATFSDWTVNQPGYAQMISGTGTRTFALSAGALPPGLTLSSSSLLAGAPTAAGSYTLTITATDSLGAVGLRTYMVTINPPVSLPPGLPEWTINQPAYNQTVSTSGGTGSKTFALMAGMLPAGLTLGSAGVLSGTPTAVGTYAFTILATDLVGASGSQAYTVTINPAVAIGTTTLSDWTVNTADYQQTLNPVGGTAPYTFVVMSGALPTGLTLGSDGVISGTPTATANFSFTVEVIDAAAAQATTFYSVAINPPVGFATPNLQDWTVNQPLYVQTVSASGGTGAATIALTAGTLPAGLTLNSVSVLVGTPTTVGTFALTFTATDSVGAMGSQLYMLTINPPVSITTPTLPNAVAPTTLPYNQTITAAGGTGPKSFSLTAGTLPPGLFFASGGTLSGLPTTPGVYTFTVTATDVTGSFASQTYTVTINSVPQITTTILPDWTANFGGYNQTITASGGIGVLTFSSAGSLPPRLTLSSNGILSGTPTSPGFYTFFVNVSDAAANSSTSRFTILISPAVMITTTALPDGSFGVSYEAMVLATGGMGTITFRLASGALPVGLALSSDGTLAGTPGMGGTYTFTVQATNGT